MKKLICIGGGDVPRYKNGVLLPYETKEIDEEIVRLTDKTNPKFLFISIASSNPEEYFEGIKKVYDELGCIVSHLDINKKYQEIEKDILDSDIIYIGGGNTRYLMEQLRTKGIDKLLVEAYNRGIVCSGLSAGSYCWFKYNYDLIEGMDVIHAVNCAHYNEKNLESKEKLYNVVRDNHLVGYAVDNQVALEFIDNDVRIIKSNNNRNAYIISYKDNKIIEEKM